MNGIFTISLDFELHWGVFDKRKREQRISCYNNTLRVVPELLGMFASSGVHVTWATVGSLFVKDKEAWDDIAPSEKPHYTSDDQNPYSYIQQHGFLPEAHVAPDIVKTIENYEGQELGSHTFSHYYCLEKGQTAEQFAADLEAVRRAAGALEVPAPVSLVFPRNQYNEKYLSICKAEGIEVVRANPAKWFWSGVSEEDTSLLRKFFRTGDTYINLGGKSSYPLNILKKDKHLPLQLPASRFLRSHDPKNAVFNAMRLKRILNEMSDAARTKECYHLWWHPEQFGFNSSENLNDLRIILSHYEKLKKRFGMQSLNMREYLSVVE